MLIRILGFIVFVGGIYLLAVFVVPEFMDRYTLTTFNQRIRLVKDESLNISRKVNTNQKPGGIANDIKSSVTDIYQTAVNTASGVSATAGDIYRTATGLISSGQQVIQSGQDYVSKKEQQLHDTVTSVERAVNAFEDAKNNITHFTSPNDTTTASTTGSTGQ